MLSRDGTKYRLSAGGLSRLAWPTLPHDFEFEIAGAIYSCPSFIAEFLSPRISNARASDPTVSKYLIQVGDHMHVFKKVLELGMGGKVEFSREEKISLALIALDLENSEIAQIVSDEVSDIISAETVNDRIAIRQALKMDIGAEIEYLASNFHSLSTETLMGLSVDVLFEVLSHPGLRILSEDSLFDFVYSRTLANCEYSVLFGLIHFDYLWKESVQDFLRWSSEFFSLVSAETWRRICGRLLVRGQSRAETRIWQGELIEYQPQGPLNGIIAHLTRVHRGNVHRLGVVTVSASTLASELHPAVDLHANSFIATRDQPNQWIQYTFEKARVRPTHYTIRSYFNGEAGYAHPKSWVIEGSNDGIEWREIDRRNDTTELNARDVKATFSITAKPTYWKMLRMRMIGPDHAGHCILRVSAIEYFGFLMNDAGS
jgi:hypothetical protein